MRPTHILYLFVFMTSIVFVLFILWIKQVLDNRRQRLMIENLNLYNKTLLNMYDGIRSIKHDFINFVQALNGYIECNDMNGVRTMANSMYHECKMVCNMEELNPHVIDNPAVYSLIVNKYQLACSQNIIMNIEITCSLQKMKIDTCQFCRILGILIDNAIEATKECKRKLINVRMLKEADTRFLIVENTYQNQELDLSKIYEKGYTTKTDSLDHGIGLWKVKDIIDNTNNLEIKTSKNDLFRQELKIKEDNKNLFFSFNGDKILLKQK